MPPQHAWLVESYASHYDAMSRNLINNTSNSSNSTITSPSPQCSNSTKGNSTCVHGTCKGILDTKLNTTNYQCVCEAGFIGNFCNSTNVTTTVPKTNGTLSANGTVSTNGTVAGTTTSPPKSSAPVGLIIFILLILCIVFFFCASVARVVIKRRIERRRIVSATEELDLEDEIYVV